MGFSDRRYASDTDGGGTRMQLGGLMMPNWPSCTAWLIIINIAVFFIDGFLGRIEHGPGGYAGYLTDWGHFSFTEAIAHGQVWRFVSYQFLHAGGWHLFSNMLTLFFFGSLCEDYWGTKRFIAYYLLCGVAGAVMYLILFGLAQAVGPAADRVPFLLISTASMQLVGASAAVFGVLIAAYRAAPKMTVLLFFVIPVPLRLLIMLVLLIEVYVVMVGGFNSGGSAAHLGGVILGLLLLSRPTWLDWALRINPSRYSPKRLRADVRRKSVERAERRSEQLDREVDRVLDKVHREGIHSLTAKEKRTLQEATERQRR